MAVPKKKVSKSKRKMRRSHLKAKLLKTNFVEDKNSGEMRRPHHIDKKPGEHKGRKIVDPD